LLHQATEAVEQSAKDAAGQESTPAKPNLYQTILSYSGLDEQEKQPERISQEGFVLLVAGSDTTARILTNGVFYVLSDRTNILPRLQKELLKVMPEPDMKASWQDLEQLSWLVRGSDLSSWLIRY
jgi:cytochrome P450